MVHDAHCSRFGTRTGARALALVVAVCTGLGAGPALAPAYAFVPDAGAQRHADPRQDVLQAPRWDAWGGSLLHDGVRGLGGGLEYAIDDSVCRDLTFIDTTSCDAVRAQIAGAAERWTRGRPDWSFVDVTASIAPAYPSPGSPFEGAGAEIDFFAAAPPAFERDHATAVGADTRTYFLFEPKPRDTSGNPVTTARGAFTSADIRFNTGECFYLDPINARPDCMHFGSVVMHEIGHAIGLDHPDVHPTRNLGFRPVRQVSGVDCTNPVADLQAGAPIASRATMRSRLRGSHPWTGGLAADDLMGRDALYPRCGSMPGYGGQDHAWGALAVGSGGAFGWSRRYDDEAGAVQRALAECAGRGNAECAVAAKFTQCFALARSSAGAFGWAVRAVEADARIAAQRNCASHGEGCAITTGFCASDASTSALTPAGP